jgi:hypothetical protein
MMEVVVVEVFPRQAPRSQVSAGSTSTSASPSEELPLGIILCAGKKRETVEVLDLDTRGIHVAEYLTEVPPRAVLEDRLHRAIKAARERLARGVAAAVEITPAAKVTPSRQKKSSAKREATREMMRP